MHIVETRLFMPAKVIQQPARQRDVNCRDCALHLICLPPSMDETELAHLDASIQRGQPLARGEVLFHQGEKFDRVFAIRSGSIKQTTVLGNGVEQITGFYFPGDIIGLESVGHPHYVNHAIALELTHLCALPYTHLQSLALAMPRFQQHIFKLIGNEVRQSHQMHLSVSKLAAQERLAIFLLSILMRHRRRNLAANFIRLSMSRGDIANFLGLTVETFSRVFGQMHDQGMLEVHGKNIQVLNKLALCHILGYEDDSLIQ
jgi:CRP/FNR family transcriptional regulator